MKEHYDRVFNTLWRKAYNKLRVVVKKRMVNVFFL